MPPSKAFTEVGSSRREIIALLPACLAAPVFLSPLRAQAPAETIILDTSEGRLRGVRRGATMAFRGIPYAADTGGANRFMAPKPVAPWTGIRDALQFGARAPQQIRPSAPGAINPRVARYGEDCCVLNIYAPVVRQAPVPVMVWIHGGGFSGGSGDEPSMDGSNLAQFGQVVVVTLNHRLNVLGYANLGHIDPEFADAANAGQLDLVAALKWIRTNIRVFGGDPSRVTLFGVSGGGSAIETLAIMPAADGLFHRAINMSGTSAFAMKTTADMEPVAETFLKNLGLSKSEIRKIQEVSPDKLREAYSAAANAHHAGDYRPTVDGRHIFNTPLSLAGMKLSSRMPWIMSNTATEASAFFGGDKRNLTVTTEQVRRRIAEQFRLDSNKASAVEAAFLKQDPQRTPWDVLAAVGTEALIRKPLALAADRRSSMGRSPVYRCEFTRRSRRDGGLWGAPHGSDVPFAFGNVVSDPASAAVDAGDEATKLNEMAAFVAFTATGNPNNRRMPHWSPYDARVRRTMVINQTCRLIQDYRGGDRLAGDLVPDQDAFDIVGGPFFHYVA